MEVFQKDSTNFQHWRVKNDFEYSFSSLKIVANSKNRCNIAIFHLINWIFAAKIIWENTVFLHVFVPNLFKKYWTVSKSL